MSNANRDPITPAERRRQAELRLRNQPTDAQTPASDAEMARLIHELRVRQIELEMQNEELERAHVDVSTGLRHLSELFAFAPISHFQLGIDGTIREVNFAGASLLGQERSRLVGKRFQQFIAEGDRFALAAFLERVVEGDNPQRCDVELTPTNRPTTMVQVSGSFSPANQQALLAVVDITERKRAEQALRDADLRLRLAVNAANVGLWDWHLGTDYLFFSPEWKRQIGYEVSEINNRFEEWRNRVHPDDLEPTLETVRAYLANPWPNYHVEFRLRHKDGSYRWILAHAALQHDEKGRPIRMLGSHVDITERKQDELALRQRVEERTAELRESEARWRALVEAEPECIKLVSSDGALLHMNASGLAMIEVASLDVVKGKCVFDMITPEHRDAYRAFHQRICDGHRGTMEYDIIGKQGTRRHMQTHAVPFRFQPTDPVVHLGITRDMTEQKRAAAVIQEFASRLQEANKWLGVLIQQFPVALMSINLHGLVMTWNPAAERMFGWTAEEVIGRPLPLVPEKDREEFSRLVVGEFHGEVRNGLELRRLRKDGSLIDVALWTAPFQEADGKVVGTVGMLIDISSQKQAEESSKASRQRLEVLSRELIDVQEKERRSVGRELHDEIGQDLTVLNYTLDRCMNPTGSDTQTDLRSAHQQVALIMNKLRDLSLRLRPPMLDDLGLLAALTWKFRQYTEQTRIAINLEHVGMDRRFPHEVETAAYRIVQEALTNVARHTRVHEVNVRLWGASDSLIVQVEDRGVGFDPEAIGVQVASRGLAGMRERAALLGADLTIEAVPGRGTRLTAEFPLGDCFESSGHTEPACRPTTTFKTDSE